jgi:hypothetical protein
MERGLVIHRFNMLVPLPHVSVSLSIFSAKDDIICIHTTGLFLFNIRSSVFLFRNSFALLLLYISVLIVSLKNDFASLICRTWIDQKTRSGFLLNRVFG